MAEGKFAPEKPHLTNYATSEFVVRRSRGGSEGTYSGAVVAHDHTTHASNAQLRNFTTTRSPPAHSSTQLKNNIFI